MNHHSTKEFSSVGFVGPRGPDGEFDYSRALRLMVADAKYIQRSSDLQARERAFQRQQRIANEHQRWQQVIVGRTLPGTAHRAQLRLEQTYWKQLAMQDGEDDPSLRRLNLERSIFKWVQNTITNGAIDDIRKANPTMNPQQAKEQANAEYDRTPVASALEALVDRFDIKEAGNPYIGLWHGGEHTYIRREDFHAAYADVRNRLITEQNT